MTSKQWWTSKECSHCPWPPSKLVRNHQWMHGLLPHILLARLFLVLVVHLLCCYCAFSLVNICSTVQTQTNPNPSPLMFSARSRPKVWSFMKVNWRFGERRSIGRGASVALVEAEEWPAFVSGGKCWKFEREEARWAEEGLERHFERRCEEEVVLLLLPQANLYFEGSSDHFQWNLSITETWAAADLWTV